MRPRSRRSSHSSHQSKAVRRTWRARRERQWPEAAGSGGSLPHGGQHPVALGVGDHREHGERGVRGGVFGGPGGEVVDLVERVAAEFGVALGEAGDHQVVGHVVVLVAYAHRVEEADHLVLGAAPAGQQEQGQPRGGVLGREGGGAVAGVGGLGAVPAVAQGAGDGGAADEGGGVGAVGLGDPPLLAPGGRALGGGQHGEAVAAQVPVGAGVRQEFTDGRPAALGEGGAGGDQVGVAECGVEGVGGPFAGTAERGRGWGHREGPSRHDVRATDHAQSSGRAPAESRPTRAHWGQPRCARAVLGCPRAPDGLGCGRSLTARPGRRGGSGVRR